MISEKIKWINQEIETKGNQITYYGDYKDKDLAKLVVELLEKDIEMLESIKKDYERNYLIREEQEPKPILNDDERKYLTSVLFPYRNCQKILIRKYVGLIIEYLEVTVEDNVVKSLPCFTKGTMYKGMEASKEYTLKELGIEYE